MPNKTLLDEMDRLRKEVDRVFKNFLDFPKMIKSKELIPVKTETSIEEKPEEFVLKVDLPGLKKADIDLRVSQNAMEVKAEKKQELKLERKGLLKHESSYRGFYRAFPLPAKVLPDKTKALYKNGVLEVRIPKAEGTAKKELKRIAIK